MDDCFLDDDCDDETSETGSDEPTEFSPDEPSDLPTDNCYGREQCFSDYSDADNNESLDSTSVDDETYSGPDCIATDCVGEPCEEGDSDTRSGSTFILTCVNGVWEGENVYHDGYSSESDSSDTSAGLVLGEVCDVEGQLVDYEYRNEYESDGRTCMITHWICENGVWDHVAECHCPPGACPDDDSGSGSIDPISSVCVGSFCAGDPCDDPGYIGDSENSILVCENGEWSAQSEPHGSLPWLGNGPPPWADENGCVDGYKWYCNDYSECYPCDYESGDSSDDSESGSGPVLFEPCDNEGEIIPISQHYTANFESSGSDDSDARIKMVKGMDLRTE